MARGSRLIFYTGVFAFFASIGFISRLMETAPCATACLLTVLMMGDLP
jgi:mannose/fructose/N-acetylgalactosamine-specific phosphotransferase system component IIC